MTEVAASKVSLICGAVLVTFFDGGHKTHTVFAHVLATGPDDENGNPTLSVAFPDPAASPQKLASPKWYEGYKRVVGVKHVDHPDVEAGRESIAWGGTLARLSDLKGEGPALPQPEGDGSRPYLKRQEPKETPEVSKGAAMAAQAGKTPASSTQSPLVNEPDSSMIENPVSGSTGGNNPAADAGSGASTGADAPPAGAAGSADGTDGQTPEGNPTAS